MVTFRCKVVVTEELKNVGFHHAIVNLGEVETDEDVSPKQYNQLKKALEKSGFELLEDKKSILVQKIINVISDVIHNAEESLSYVLSVYLSNRLDYDYVYLSGIFSESMGMTIESYFSQQRIERVTELLIYNELTLTEIASKMHYRNEADLSNEFKKTTGLSPTEFRNRKAKTRSFLEDI